MTMNIDDETSKKLHKLLQDLGHFIALYEQTEDRLQARKDEADQQLDVFKNEIQSQLEQIQQTVMELTEVMTAAGAARWRVAAEKSLKLGDEHLHAIQDACKVFKKLADHSASRLEHLAVAVEKRINQSMQQLQDENFSAVEGFKRRAQNTYDELETVTTGAINTLKRLMRWLRWDRVVISILAALLASLLTSMYLNAEYPWETRTKVTQERSVGKSLMDAWPKLPKQKQDEIKKLLGIQG